MLKPSLKELISSRGSQASSQPPWLRVLAQTPHPPERVVWPLSGTSLFRLYWSTHDSSLPVHDRAAKGGPHH